MLRCSDDRTPPATEPNGVDAVLARLGANIAEHRAARGLTQRDLAARAGVDRAFLNRVEGGLRNPTIMVLAKVAHGLSITVGELTAGL